MSDPITDMLQNYAKMTKQITAVADGINKFRAHLEQSGTPEQVEELRAIAKNVLAFSLMFFQYQDMMIKMWSKYYENPS